MRDERDRVDEVEETAHADETVGRNADGQYRDIQGGAVVRQLDVGDILAVAGNVAGERDREDQTE